MKKIMMIVIALFVLGALNNGPTFPGNPLATEESEAAIKYVSGYTTKSGQYRSGHYRDTSNDGNSWNNANTLGYND